RHGDARSSRDPADPGRRPGCRRVKRPPVHRLIAVLVVAMFAMAGIVVRLAFLQVRESGTYAALGSTQRVRTEALPVVRGEILDRDGVPMALTLEARDIYANPSLVTAPRSEAAQIAAVLGEPKRPIL